MGDSAVYRNYRISSYIFRDVRVQEMFSAMQFDRVIMEGTVPFVSVRLD